MATDIIRVPLERADQLRALATQANVSITERFSGLVTDEIRRLGLENKIGLGATIDVCDLEDGTIYFAATTLGTFQWAPAVARSVADTIDSAIVSKGGTLDLDAGLEITRAGTSIKLRNVETSEERTFAPKVAQDLAALIRSNAR